MILALSLISATFAMASSPSRKLGDVDGDGTVAAEDARITLRAAVKLQSLSRVEQLAADADLDGRVTPSDARLILRASVKLEKLPDVFISTPTDATPTDPGTPTDATPTDPGTPTDATPTDPATYYVPKTITLWDSFESKNKQTQYRLEWKESAVIIDGNAYLAFDEDGKLRGGGKSESRFFYTPYEFLYEGESLNKATASGVWWGDPLFDGQEMGTCATFDDEGRLTKVEKSFGTIGYFGSYTYGAQGVSNAEYFGGGFFTKTTYRYEDAAHPGRITSAVVYDVDSRYSVVLSYSYDPDGTLSCISTDEIIWDDIADSERYRPLYLLIRFAYNSDRCLTSVEYNYSNSPDMTDSHSELLEIEYQPATAAQYRAFRQIGACSFNNLLPGTFIPITNGRKCHSCCLLFPLPA